MHRKIGLDFPRAVAIALVVASHFVKKLEGIGYFGVELFFALSGFLIGGILYRDLLDTPRWSFAATKRFWLRRWWRTLPNFYLFLLVTYLFDALHGKIPSLTTFVPFLVFSQGLLSPAPDWYGVSWSLCIEEWFYLLFPLSILLFTVCGCTRRWSFIWTTAAFLVVPAGLRLWLFRTDTVDAVRKVTFARLDAIFYGVALAFVVKRFSPALTPRRLAFASGLVVLGAMAAVAHTRATPENPLPFTAPMMVFAPLGFALTLPWLATVENLPGGLRWLGSPVRNVSLWSYSIYLYHVTVLFGTYDLLYREEVTTPVKLACRALSLGLTLLIARAVYLYFEQPLMSLRPPSRVPATPVREPD